jgi:sec-independent protein translocase protein TatA
MPNLGFQELLLIFGIAVLIFGSTRIPMLGRGIGEGIRNFKKGLRGEEDEPKEQLPESHKERTG